MVRLQVSVHDKKPRRHFEKGQRHIFERGIRKCSGVKLAEHGQRDTEGLGKSRKHGGGGGGHGEISFQHTAGKKGARLLRADDVPAGFANAPQVQGFYSLSVLSKCIEFTGPLESAHQIW